MIGAICFVESLSSFYKNYFKIFKNGPSWSQDLNSFRTLARVKSFFQSLFVIGQQSVHMFARCMYAELNSSPVHLNKNITDP